MAKATIECAKCGKSIEIVERNRREADRRAAYYAAQGRVCGDCHKAQFRAEHAATVAAAAADPITAGLPALTGSEKQVAWAQALRLQALPAIDRAVSVLLAALNDDPVSEAAKSESRDALHLIAQELRDRTAASDWINTRGTSYTQELARELNRRLPTLAPTAHAELTALRG